MSLQRPRLTRYPLAESVWVPRLKFNRHGRKVIGLALLAGRSAYSVTWARPADPPPSPGPPDPDHLPA